MPRRSGWQLTPRQSVELECARRGPAQVVAGCVALLRRQEVDDNLVLALGGPLGQVVLDDGPRQVHQYWRRVWGARGLLYAWAGNHWNAASAFAFSANRISFVGAFTGLSSTDSQNLFNAIQALRVALGGGSV